MADKSTLSVIVPALNEEKNLETAVANVVRVASRFFSDCEILIFNDGSTDQTGVIANRLAAGNSSIRVIHHKTPLNLGACYKEGLHLAKNQYVIMIPGDGECAESVMEKVFPLAGAADIIIPYTSNLESRPLGRRLLSVGFVHLMNLLSGCNLRYYNGAVMHQTDLVRSHEIQTNGFGYQAELLVSLIRKGHSYLEVGTSIEYRKEGKSKALTVKNALQTLGFLSLLARSRLVREV